MWSNLEKIIFPAICTQTGAYCEELDLSKSFLKSLEPPLELCPVCAGKSITNRVCGKCQSEPPIITKIQVGYLLNEPLKKMVHDYKYSKNLFYSRLFSEIIEFDSSGVDALVPVPLHLNRLSKRGFNQSLEIAKFLGKKYNLPVIDAVNRIKDTPQQTKLNKKGRQQNLKGAFEVIEQCLQNIDSIAIIDDVITTGSTINEIAKILNKQQPNLIIQVWVVAKAV